MAKVGPLLVVTQILPWKPEARYWFLSVSRTRTVSSVLLLPERETAEVFPSVSWTWMSSASTVKETLAVSLNHWSSSVTLNLSCQVVMSLEVKVLVNLMERLLAGVEVFDPTRVQGAAAVVLMNA